MPQALPDYKKDREGAITALTLLGSFARPARELLLGLQLPAAALAAETAVPAELAQVCVCGAVCVAVCGALSSAVCAPCVARVTANSSP